MVHSNQAPRVARRFCADLKLFYGDQCGKPTGNVLKGQEMLLFGSTEWPRGIMKNLPSFILKGLCFSHS